MADYSWASGLLLGLSAGISPGPLLTLVISQTLRHGRREGIKVALAPLITDLPIITGALVLGAWFTAHPGPLGLLSLAGAVYIAYLAWESITMSRANHESIEQPANSVRRGVLANLLNPHPYLFWLTVGAPLVISAWSDSPRYALVWLMGFYLMLVGAKVVLAMFAGGTRSWLKGNVYIWINRLLGAALLLFAFTFFKEGLILVGLRIP